MRLLDGKALGETIKGEIAEQVAAMVADGERQPHLAAVLVGNDGASETYVRSKVQSCERVGFASTLLRLPETVSEADLLKTIRNLNDNPDIDGFIVQLPLPRHIRDQAILQAIDPRKDVDGFHPVNVGRMTLGLPSYLPATPYGIMTLLDRYGVETAGAHAVVLGRSAIVGTPMSILLSRNSKPGNCTVTLCHSRSRELPALCRQADILIAALGIPGYVTADMVRDGAAVIDVGITRIPDASRPSGYRLSGDVAFDQVAPKCSWITPVPGGVGPMTVTSLLLNTLQASKRTVSS
ncbi:MAG: bifunctional 5,10-methylene-tetrahydrofolate dehydrogenase/5,10-methylene-tetrahydrofolate cyclohydrolase [Bacteroidetes bacterium]|nr:bifunctional 5,10-methylene-tetrahydrofolate dehydrogenase/5,10-methylene-tetrahydrofolate cyclohydrolase [Bacteroidota bacterium]